MMPARVALALQADGKIIAVGVAWTSDHLFHTYPSHALVRYNPDGSLDPSFGVNGSVIILIGVSSEASAVALQPDGKIVTAGWGAIGLQMTFAVARHLAGVALPAGASLSSTSPAILSGPMSPESNGLDKPSIVALLAEQSTSYTEEAESRIEDRGSTIAIFYPPSSIFDSMKCVLEHNGLVSLRANRNQDHLGLEDFFQPVNIPLCIDRQIREFPRS
jgi:uncharacterized delta-60 repeat protein